MTRIKKSRTSGQIGIRNKPKSEARQERDRPEESKKKGAGLKSGSRNAVLLSKDHAVQQKQKNKDPRHGSKKPIELVLSPAEEKLMLPTTQPKAQLAKVRPVALAPADELAQLEQDERLLALVDRVEQGEILTGKDAKYFNSKTARHAELLSMLGLDDADAELDDADASQPDDPIDPMARFEQTDWRKELLGDD